MEPTNNWGNVNVDNPETLALMYTQDTGINVHTRHWH